MDREGRRLAPWAFRAGYLFARAAYHVTYRVAGLLRSDLLYGMGAAYVGRRAVEQGRLARADAIAAQLLAIAESNPSDWNSGNLHHQAHLIAGRIALRRGDVDRAERELLEAGRTKGSPQLGSFGPNMSLARELLEAGRPEPVLAYLDACQAFWEMGGDQLAEWRAVIRRGEVPDFGPHLIY